MIAHGLRPGEIEPFSASTEPVLNERLAELWLIPLDKWIELSYINK